ncbi:MAG: hypothetical protein AAB358_00035 [Patescibacteria group bacterium]
MCKSWKKERSNHHFPEFSKKGRILKLISDHFNWMRLAVSFSVLAVIVGFVYLFSANFVATKGYKMEELQNKIDQLKEENKNLNLKYIELKSMANLSTEVAKMDLVASEKAEVLSVLGSTVALNH